MLPKKMQERLHRCVCRYCGTKLEIKVMIYNQYGGAGAELYCPRCNKIEYGVEPEIYKTAKNFVDSLEFNYYYNLPEDERSYYLNIAKVAEILTWSAQHWGLMNHSGLREDIVFIDEE